MTKTDTDFVTALHEAVKARLGTERYELWFRDKVTFKYSANRLRVDLSDEFALDQVRRSFGRIVSDIAAAILGDEVAVEWRATASVERDPQRAPTPGSTRRRAVADEDPTGVGSSPDVSDGDGSPAGRRQVCSDRASDTIRLRSDRDAAETWRARRKRNQGTFATFISGENSQLAYAACRAVSGRLGEVSPIFVHGPTGCGKTHLLQSVYSDTMGKTRAACVFVSAEQFTSNFLEALHGHGLPSFRRKFRSSDLLIIDDVQFFVGKRATLIELLHTIDALTNAGKQIVLAADRPPSEINGLNAEIIARLSGGLVCGIDYPHGATRRQLAEHLAKMQSFPVTEEIVEMISQEIHGDARLMRGAWIRLNAIANATQQTITPDRARDELSDIFQAGQRQPAIADIERVVCEVFGVDGKQLRSGGKSKVISQPRMLAMWLARKHTRAAYSEIGDYFGGRSHSTVISAHHRVEEWVDSNKPIRVAHGESPVADTIRRIETTLRAV